MRSSAPPNKLEIQKFWNRHPCGSHLSDGAEVATPEFFENTEKARYAREPFIRDFACFEKWTGKKVLEVGVGMGTDHSMFARHGAQVWGIDLTFAGVSLTARRLANRGLKARVAVGDCESLPFPDGLFDLVYSWGVIHVTPNTSAAAREIARVTRPGGKVVVMIYNRRSLVALQAYLYYGLLRGRIYRSLADVVAAHLESPGMKTYTAHEARELFGDYLENLRITPVVTPYDLRIGRERFLPEWVRGMVPASLGYFLVIEGIKPERSGCNHLPK